MSALFEDYAVTVLGAKRRSGGIWADFRCRAHDDNSASCSINIEDGRVHCQASSCGWQGWVDEYAVECGLPSPPDKEGWRDGKPIRSDDLGSLQTSTPLADTRPRPSATFPYDDAEGRPYRRVQRFDLGDGKKTFRQSAFVDGKWTGTIPKNMPPILYRVRELLARKTSFVLICEGEKGADCARKLGFPATTAPQGAGNADKVEDWMPLAGADVAIIADNDPPGMRHAKQVAGLLIGVARSICIITMPGVPEKGDLVDWVEAGGDADQLRELIEGTPRFGASTDTPARPATKSREYIELSYLSAAVEHRPTARTLGTFHHKRWKSGLGKAISSAFRKVEEQDQNPTLWNLSQALMEAGRFEAFEAFEEFYVKRFQPSGQFRGETYAAFREACNKDDVRAILRAELEQIDQSAFKQAATRLHDKASHLVARMAGQGKMKTLKQHMLEYMDDLDAGTAEKRFIRLRLLDPVTGPFGGGDAVYLCGGPKVGKTGFLMALLRDAGQEGHKSLLLQLELRIEQVCEREGAYILGKRLSESDAEERDQVRRSGILDRLDNIIVAPQCTSLEEANQVLLEAFGQYPDISIFGIDYNEMLQSFDGKSDQLSQTERVSDWVKKTATAHKKLGILLAQPKEEYYKDCKIKNVPLVTHWKRGSKMRQDSQALCFLHCPNFFDDTKPENYLELHVQLCRDAPGSVIPLMVDRGSFIYSPWPKDRSIDTPPRASLVGASRTRDQYLEMEEIPL